MLTLANGSKARSGEKVPVRKFPNLEKSRVETLVYRYKCVTRLTHKSLSLEVPSLNLLVSEFWFVSYCIIFVDSI